ncbi:MAG TPA: VWA domain-containing protein [Pyrinomonadaceae bacterium]|nr:VWA domain-containing protein [Pyrinomonadaceae bacterium]
MPQISMLYRIIFAITLSLTLLVSATAQSGRTRNTPSPQPGNTTSPNSGKVEEPAPPDQVDGPPETIEGDTLRVDTSLVTLPVSVMDRYGRYIPNLSKKDFRIFDQGVEQKIAYFATVDQPFTVALVLDTSDSTHFKLEDIQNAAIAFVNQLQNQDRVMVVTFDDSIKVLSEPTSDRETLARAIRKTKNGGGTRLYDAVEMVIKKKLSGFSGRKAIVLFTDGVDTTSRSASYWSTIRQAQESDGAIFTVSYDTSSEFGNLGQGIPTPGSHGNIGLGIPGWPGGNGGRGGYPGGGAANSPEYRLASQYLHELSDTSGGRFYRGDSLADVATAFADIADELRRQYSLGYYPRPIGTAGQVRQIKVRVNQPNLVVKTRESYIYAKKDQAKEIPTQKN